MKGSTGMGKTNNGPQWEERGRSKDKDKDE